MLDGTWKPVSAQLNGAPFPSETMMAMKLVLEGDAYTAYVGDQIDRGKIELQPESDPKTMDVIGTEGPNQGKKMPAIYRLDDDALTVCYSLSGSERPTEFSSTPENQYFLVTYRRQS